MAKLKQDPHKEILKHGTIRRVRMESKGMTVALTVATTIFLAVIALAALGMGEYQRDLATLAREGKVVTAQVAARYKKSSDDYKMDLGFHVNGRYVESSTSVSKEVYRDTPRSGHLTITYLPSDPHVIKLGQVTQAMVTANMKSMFWAMGCLILFFAGVIWVIRRCGPEPEERDRVIFNKP